RELVVDEIERADVVQAGDRNEHQDALDDVCSVRLHARLRAVSRARAGVIGRAARRAIDSHPARSANSCVIIGVKIVSRWLPGTGLIGAARSNHYGLAALISAFSAAALAVTAGIGIGALIAAALAVTAGTGMAAIIAALIAAALAVTAGTGMAALIAALIAAALAVTAGTGMGAVIAALIAAAALAAAAAVAVIAATCPPAVVPATRRLRLAVW